MVEISIIKCITLYASIALSKGGQPNTFRKPINYDAVFNNLKFGYERNTELSVKKVNQELLPLIQPSALCYSKSLNRPRGCESLLTEDTSATVKNSYNLEDLMKSPLPCVTDGTCPYVQFRCSNGHRWKAISGSPVCFSCPQCGKARSKIFGLKFKDRRKVMSPDNLLSAIKNHAALKGGSCISLPSKNDITQRSVISLRCQEGHEWSSTVGNIIHNKAWCKKCFTDNRKFNYVDMNETAEYFGGKFLGFQCDDDQLDLVKGELLNPNMKNNSLVINDQTTVKRLDRDIMKNDKFQSVEKLQSKTQRTLQRLALWRCAEGHEFYQYACNIRRYVSL